MNRIYARRPWCAMLLGMSKRGDAVRKWREILRRQAGSGLSVAAFCRRARVPQASFYAWRRKLRDSGVFAEVRVVPDSALADGGLRRADPRTSMARVSDSAPAGRVLQLVLPGGRSILVGPGFDRATLLALLDVLEHNTAPCAGEEAVS